MVDHDLRSLISILRQFLSQCDVGPWLIFILRQFLTHCDIGPLLTMDDHDCKPKRFISNPMINIINPMNNIIPQEYEPNKAKRLIL